LHEIKHDGFRMLALRDAAGVRLYTRNGGDFTKRLLLVVASVMALPARSCLIGGEAIVSDASGLAVFELIRSFRHDHAAVLCAFDLLELDGEDLRRLPIEKPSRRGLGALTMAGQAAFDVSAMLPIAARKRTSRGFRVGPKGDQQHLQ
jgi:ATP-dependent DNA ligase